MTEPKNQELETIEVLEQALYEALPHLNAPVYQPSALLWQVLRVPQQQGIKGMQSALIKAIEALKPAPDVAPYAHSQRIYELLSLRYRQGLTQEETGDRLGLSIRQIRREQKRAIHNLAQWLWGQRRTDTPAVAGTPSADGGNIETDPWRSQVRQELDILQQNIPETKSEVAAVMAGVVQVGQVLTAKHNIQLKVDPIPKNLTAMIQPSALRQILLTAIEKLVQHMTSGEIVLLAEMAGEFITLTVTGGPIVTDTLPDSAPLPNSALIQELLGDHGDTFNIQRAGETIVFQFRLSATGDPISVLVVDDNADLVTFFRISVTNTRYQIIHLADGERLFETIAATKPNLIVLDVLLPGMDGWELLAYLHEHPDTRAIPIIVCSVIRREDLALALGASFYLPKPVRRQEFIEALDEAYSRVTG
ncbi:response regulator [Chloroflexi bacterium TSY]|nr:response regulator [Chloroflexi bacterium TSY]